MCGGWGSTGAGRRTVCHQSCSTGSSVAGWQRPGQEILEGVDQAEALDRRAAAPARWWWRPAGPTERCDDLGRRARTPTAKVTPLAKRWRMQAWRQQVVRMRRAAVRGADRRARRRSTKRWVRGPIGIGDHVALQALVVADAGVEAGRQHVDEAVLGDHLQRDARVGGEEPADDRRQDGARDDDGHVQAQRAGGRVAELVDGVERGGDFAERRGQALQQALRRPRSASRCGWCGSAGGRRGVIRAGARASLRPEADAPRRAAAPRKLRARATGGEGVEVGEVGFGHCAGFRTACSDDGRIIARMRRRAYGLRWSIDREGDAGDGTAFNWARTGPRVSALGLGCMGMSGMYGPADRAESIATIHAALEAGSTCSTPATSTAWATTRC